MNLVFVNVNVDLSDIANSGAKIHAYKKIDCMCDLKISKSILKCL